jgi:hypothetical protein
VTGSAGWGGLSAAARRSVRVAPGGGDGERRNVGSLRENWEKLRKRRSEEKERRSEGSGRVTRPA